MLPNWAKPTRQKEPQKGNHSNTRKNPLPPIPKSFSRHFSLNETVMEESSYELLDIDDSDLLSSIPLHLPTTTLPSHFSTPLKPCSAKSKTLDPQFKLPDPSSSSSSPKSFIIPGPAGAIQSAMHRKSSGNNHNHTSGFSSTQELLTRSVQEQDEIDNEFKMNPWICGMDFVKRSRCDANLGSIVNTQTGFSRIPQVVGIVTSCTPNGLGDLIVTLKDPSGTIGGNVHRKVVAMSEFGKDISVGSVLVLQEVAVFSPTPTSHYLNITLENVIKVIRKDSGPPLSDGYPISSFKAAPSFTGTTDKPSSGRLTPVAENTTAPVDMDMGRRVNRNVPVNRERTSNLQSLFKEKFSHATNTISIPHTVIEVEPLVREVPSQSQRLTQTHVPLEAPIELNTEKQAKEATPQSLNSNGNTVSRDTILEYTEEQLAELIDDDWDMM